MGFKSISLEEKQNPNLVLKEWLGFNYNEYLSFIKVFIRMDNFDLLKATNELDLRLGKLDSIKIDKLKTVLIDGFDKGSSIREIQRDILDRVDLPSLKKLQNGELVTRMPRDYRALVVARTETTRVANEGSKLEYKEGGVKAYRWVAALSDRTCPVCEGLNGQLFSINNKIVPPAHVMCRCTIIPEVKLE